MKNSLISFISNCTGKFLWAFCLVCMSMMQLMAQQQTAPNILLIISDDFGVDVTSGMYPGLIEGLLEQYGPEGFDHPEWQSIDGLPASTPTLDQFAREGMIFTNTWAHPFCSPTRASILTGLFATRAGVLTYADPLSQNHDSFVRILKEVGGYSTGLFGKWHLAGLPGQELSYTGMKPKEAGFDIFRGNLHAAIATYWEYDYQVQDQTTAADEWKEMTPPLKSLPGIAPTTYAPVVKIADAIEWIKQQEDTSPDQPWFAWVATNLSHATAIQQPSAMAVPNADTLDPPSLVEMQACGGEFGSNNVGVCSGESLMRAMTNSMDTIIGKLIHMVDALDPNTYIIFVGDNGTPMYARPNLDFIENMYITRTGRGKGTVYESGARVPMAIKGPGIQPGSVSDEYVHTADLFSTILSFANLNAPLAVSNTDGSSFEKLDAVSLTPLLFAESEAVRDPDYGYMLSESVNLMTGGTSHIGARNRSYKLVCVDGLSPGECDFYNLDDDPLEEYPLDEPESCLSYQTGQTDPSDADWHYCRLSEVVASESFL